MKKTILWPATSVLVISIAVGCYVANCGAQKSDDTGKETEISRGLASFYGVGENGTRTASGVPLDDSVSTAAHRTLPFGTLVRVTNLDNGLAETVEITDRGPFVKKRIIDVSRNAAEKLGMIKAGVVSVEIEVLPASNEPPRPVLAED